MVSMLCTIIFATSLVLNDIALALDSKMSCAALFID